MKKIQPVDEEIRFEQNEIIVSKTDLKGKITYANDVFCRVAEMDTTEVIGQPHSIIRHPDMPRSVFKLLWDTIQSSNEIFAYVKNMSATGKYYWVIAHVTPSKDPRGNICGYHSNRRMPSDKGIQEIEALYAELRRLEKSVSNRKDGLKLGSDHIDSMLASMGKAYDEFIWSTGEQ